MQLTPYALDSTNSKEGAPREMAVDEAENLAEGVNCIAPIAFFCPECHF
jgi:hypothetical protein